MNVVADACGCHGGRPLLGVGCLVMQVLVGFADKLRLMNVLMDDVKVIKEVSACGQLYGTVHHLFCSAAVASS